MLSPTYSWRTLRRWHLTGLLISPSAGCYIDGIFANWHQSLDRLRDFPDHLNSTHQIIQFITEVERDGQIPFLDRCLQKAMCHKVYHNLIYTNLYVNSSSHHHPSNKNAVLSTLVQRPELFMAMTAFTLSGRIATATSRFPGLSILQ
jgi:hypothetical protein